MFRTISKDQSSPLLASVCRGTWRRIITTRIGGVPTAELVPQLTRYRDVFHIPRAILLGTDQQSYGHFGRFETLKHTQLVTLMEFTEDDFGYVEESPPAIELLDEEMLRIWSARQLEGGLVVTLSHISTAVHLAIDYGDRQPGAEKLRIPCRSPNTGEIITWQIENQGPAPDKKGRAILDVTGHADSCPYVPVKQPFLLQVRPIEPPPS